MAFVWFVLFVLVIFGIRWVIGRGVNRGAAVVSGALTGNTRTRGLAAVHRGQKLSLPVDGRQLVDKLVQTLELGAQWNDGLRLELLDDDHAGLVISVGGPRMETAKFSVTTEPSGDGATGEAAVASWREVEGRIPATDSIERIQRHVLSAITQLGGTVLEHGNA